MKKDSFKRIIIATVVCLVIVISLLFLLNLVNNNKSNEIPTPVLKMFSPTPSAKFSEQDTNESEFINSTYSNEKYNFKFKYQSEYKFGGKTAYRGWIEEKNNQIVYKQFRESDKTMLISEKYLIYDVNESDQNDVASWWSKNIKTDVENGVVPFDYNVEKDIASLLWQSDKPLQHWDTAPKGIIVSLNNDATLKLTRVTGQPVYSVYLYYNFGKPFIVNFVVGNSGAGATAGVFSSIERLY